MVKSKEYDQVHRGKQREQRTEWNISRQSEIELKMLEPKDVHVKCDICINWGHGCTKSHSRFRIIYKNAFLILQQFF